MAPIFVALMSYDHIATFTLAYVVFVAAAITDYYDGHIARTRNLVTNFGKLFDPVADKVLMAAAFVMMMHVRGLIVPGWTVVVILSREFLITGARSLAAGDGEIIAANAWGKTKTVIQIVYILTFLFFVIVERAIHFWIPNGSPMYQYILSQTSLWAVIFVAFFTAYSGFQFIRVNWSSLQLGKQS
jgi:CDP-diacylglycerol--glycerol-3-phosphate 3-phosphatidyltransferase